METRPIREDELAAVSAWVAAQQQDPSRHIAYLADGPAAVSDGLRALSPRGLDGVLVAVERGEIIGLLAVEHDDDPPRAWWHGPFVAATADLATVAGLLYAAARAELPAGVSQEEFAPDDRNVEVGRFAEVHGFVPEEASAVLCRALGNASDPDRLSAGAPPAGVELGPLTPATVADVARLHDELFPGAHTTGRVLAAPGEGKMVLVARRDGEPVGYVAVERQEDGSGYVDYLGVRPGARRGGVGRALVAAGCARLRDDLGCPTAHLTVRESNRGARRVYEQLGFTEERLIRPWRRGFSLA